jgi:hypothetical protein
VAVAAAAAAEVVAVAVPGNVLLAKLSIPRLLTARINVLRGALHSPDCYAEGADADAVHALYFYVNAARCDTVPYFGNPS